MQKIEGDDGQTYRSRQRHVFTIYEERFTYEQYQLVHKRLKDSRWAHLKIRSRQLLIASTLQTKATKQWNMANSAGKHHIGRYSEGHLLKLTKKLVQEKTSKTRLFDKDAEMSVPQIDVSGECE